MKLIATQGTTGEVCQAGRSAWVSPVRGAIVVASASRVDQSQTPPLHRVHLALGGLLAVSVSVFERQSLYAGGNQPGTTGPGKP